jgi:hypothetical protein
MQPPKKKLKVIVASRRGGVMHMTRLAVMLINADIPEVPEWFLKASVNKPYYRRFEKKRILRR